ncbi:class I tRNA ligase family protein [Candidatus Amesbacteria bacterium]|nr:class I tRNA ligase family protein [Candidatus Amesbacteria bacterium]
MEKSYNHLKFEKEIYEKWERSGAFSPTPNLKRKPFTIIMPPPNANDNLHIGHARFVAVEDILIRYHRMLGDPTLWLPGADHAGIETQFVFEKKLKLEGKSRFDYDGETLYKMVWDYVQENKSTMENQLRVLGASCDWSRNKFTLDPEIIKIVYKTFAKLLADGLVYKGKKLVNYCTRCGTAYSELEVDRIERTDPLYFVRYKFVDGAGYVVAATTRPEPIWADTHLAVNPRDKKNKSLIGKSVVNPLTDAKMEIIGDSFVDPEFGTGIVKLTPAHDFGDFEVAERHGLSVVEAVGKEGKITSGGGKYAGLTVKAARELTVLDLKEKGLMEKIDENYSHIVGVCYRCKSQIEPVISEQWFVRVAPLVKMAKDAVVTGRTKFAAPRFKKIYLHWLDNLRDWNISRQIVWGIKIPVEGETDTFDTWFSSGQWPFATLQTTMRGDFKTFYPTSVMNTAYDILPFWVMRMMMLGIYVTGKVPFETVLIHGLVRDKRGLKISKSKGNVIDPIIMVDKYGSDALRMALVWGGLIENDICLAEENVKAMRNFANKIWNIGRFIESVRVEEFKSVSRNADDEWILDELNKLIKTVTSSLEKYRFNQAAEEIYEFVWHKFADIYIEKIKDRKDDAAPTLRHVLITCLKLLHPFMPFVTEALWSELRITNKELGEMLITASWPT